MLRTDEDPELLVFDPVIRFLHWLTLFLFAAIFALEEVQIVDELLPNPPGLGAGRRSKRPVEQSPQTVGPRGDLNLRARCLQICCRSSDPRSPTQLTRVVEVERFEGLLELINCQTSAGLIETGLLGTVTALIGRREKPICQTTCASPRSTNRSCRAGT